MKKALTVYKASAGSGKTFRLTVEYIKLLVENPQAYRQILAVTFTNKATEEMKMRILSQLYGIWRHLDDSHSYTEKIAAELGATEEFVAERAGEALHLLLHNYSYFRVETIDSFFQSVLRNLARELDLTANLRISLNDTQVEELAVDQLIENLTTTDEMLQWLLRYIMDSISDDRSWNVISQIKQFGRTIFRDYYKEESSRLHEVMSEKHFFDNYTKMLREQRDRAKEKMDALAHDFFDTMESEGIDVDDLSYGKSGVASIFFKILSGQYDESIISKRVADAVGQPEKWCKKTHERREQIYHLAETSLGDILRRTIDEQPRQWRRYQSAVLTLRHLSQLRLLGSIETKVRELNETANRFLLSDTQQLLHDLIEGSDSPFIFEKIGTQLEHIMIDEFQDTSTVQWQNFKVLLEETMSHEDTSNLIVGDVKQSIYRWRSGDWRLLANIDQQFQHAGERLEITSLDTNYRSDSRVIYFNNAFFVEAARQEGIDAYGSKDDIGQHVPQGKTDNGVVQVMLLPSKDYQEETLRLVLQRVDELLAEGVPATDIAVLVRSNSSIPLIANYFMEMRPEIPVVSDEAFRLDASPAVITIIQALQYLAHPEDIIAEAFLKKMYTRTQHNGLTDGWSSASLPETFTKDLLQMPLYDLTEQLYGIFHLDRLEGQSAYLCAFYDQITTYAADHSTDVNAFLREWEESICEKTIQSPEVNGIRLISIHKSKGLEFPVVIVPFCDWRMEHNDILWCRPQEEPFSALPIAPIDFSEKGMKGTIYEKDYQEEHGQNMVDNLNLLYVAFTRAVNRLYVYGKRNAKTSRSALIEQVLPEITGQLSGATYEGEADKEQPLVFSYGEATIATIDTIPTKAPIKNPFLTKSEPLSVGIEVFSPKVSFKQSNKSIDFSRTDDDDEQQSKTNYIQLGSVLHQVFSTIRTAKDVDKALRQLELEGIIYDRHITRERIEDLIRKRLADSRVADWFSDRWTLFNECTILSVNPSDNKVYERRPDRVLTDGNETVVIDYKFGKERDDYHDQVREYMTLLRQMGHTKVKGFLWFVYSNRIVEVKELRR